MLPVTLITWSQKESFSSALLPIWGAYAQMQVTNLSPINTFKHIMCSFTLFASTTLSIHLSEIRNPTPALPFLQPCQKNLYRPWHVHTHHSSTWSCQSSFLYTAYINLSPMQYFHYFCRPAWHSSNVPGCKSYAVSNIRGILQYPHRHHTPAGHQVYDLHNDRNSILQFGRVPHRLLFLVGRWVAHEVLRAVPRPFL